MKNQTNKILVAFLTTIFVLSGIGYSAEMPPTDYNWNENSAEFEKNAPPVCTEVTNSDILLQINHSPESLRRQFRDKTIAYSYVNQRLTFTGYVYGNGNNLRSLIGGFDKLRGEKCIRVVSFEGDTAAANFEWRSDPDSPPSDPLDGCDVAGVIDKFLENQLNKTFFYTYNKTTGILEFSGILGDAPGKGKFNSLVAQLQRFMKNGCIKKIVFVPKDPEVKEAARLQNSDGKLCITNISFTPKTSVIDRLLLSAGFEWQICEYPLCECSGRCISCSQPC